MNDPESPSSNPFGDRYAACAAGYAAHRPTYPAALVDYLARIAPRCDLAWEAGCGSGQLSVPLAERFRRVVATDASAAQLASAAAHPRVEYRRAPAEASGLPEGAADLAVAAQAAHWFDLPAYYAEVRRVTREASILALVTYGLPAISPQVDVVLHRFHHVTLRGRWPAERRHVDDGYRSLPFPFEEIEAPPLDMRARWSLPELFGYLETWSGVRALIRAEGRGPIEELRRELARAWGAEGAGRTVRWPLSLRVGRL